ncbi:ABC transporter substrate-binding protein [Algibacter luteus]|uniref:ABC transporter substrate-binding protein n=1 Tax=Algibacter luteus TaxID=1178825 RepID=UPI002595BF2B|nr:ABC transporter substrate-binding protein [Algibacter luteus]WJJ97911.1 ABC transporter substrate-binding protein [Algibacter luteus]
MFKSDNYHITTMTKTFLYLFLICSLLACNKKVKTEVLNSEENQKSELKYAEGFSITKTTNYTIIEINQPWPNAEKSYKYMVISKANAAKTSFLKDEFDGIIITPIEKIVVTSTTHLPALELLEEEETLVGFPGTHYISSESIRNRIDNNKVGELGKNEGINTEVLLELNPDLVVGFGIDGGNRSLEIIKKSGVPVIFNGDWVEHSPLAKAEWIKFFGVLYNKEKKADSIFNHIEKDYLATKQLALNATTKPSVLSGAMHNDIWYLPNGNSTEAQLLIDANVNYLWNDSEGKGSLQLNFESVFVKARDANIWLNPSNYSSLDALKNGNENHAMFDAFKNKNVYSFTNTTGITGGVLYYELGMARPDLVLKDLIKICHPNLLQDYKPFFFKPLE